MLDKVRHMPRMGMNEAQKLFGLTARALRFYEERGLVTAQRDRLNCRYFDGLARRRIDWIAALRRAGVSLPDIREVLDADEHEGRGEAVALAKLEARRRALNADLAAVEAMAQRLRPADPAPLARKAPAAA